jgi:hypothetical protein
MHLNHLPRTTGVLLLLGSITIAGPAPARAQGSTSFTLWGGVYSPLGADPNLGAIGGQVERENSFAGGGRLTLWGRRLFGLEVVAGLTPAKVNVAGGVINGTRNLNVFAGGLKLMLGVSPAVSSVGFHLGAGPALKRRGEDVAPGSESHTDFGGVLGAGIRVPFSPRVALRLDAEDYIYSGSFGGNEGTRNDLILSTGISFGL